MNFAKPLVTRLIDKLPSALRKQVLQGLATLTPGLRNRFLYRVALRAILSYQGERVFRTNLGISRRYNCLIPYDLSSGAIWGKPNFDYGEWHSMQLAGFLSRHCDAFIDVGAYIGYYVFYVWDYLRGTKPIYFFEPVNEYFDIIKKNVASCNLEGITGFNKAMGDRDGTAKFFRNNLHSTCGSLTDRYAARDDIEEIEVSVITFTSFIKSTGHLSVCVKVDIEGAEQLFLDGAEEALDRITYLIIEVLNAESPFLLNARSLGFHVYHIAPEGLRWRPEGTDIYIPNQWNWLLCRYKPNELSAVLIQTNLRVVV